MIKYTVSIKKLRPKHINSARYSFEIKVFNDQCLSPHAGAYGCTLTLRGAKSKLRRELHRIDSILSPNSHSEVVVAQGSIDELKNVL